MKSDKIIIIAQIQQALAAMDEKELAEVLGFVDHCREVNKMTDPRSEAMHQINEALIGNYEF